MATVIKLKSSEVAASVPKELKDAILAAPAKMLKPSAMKMMKKSVAKMGYKKK